VLEGELFWVAQKYIRWFTDSLGLSVLLWWSREGLGRAVGLAFAGKGKLHVLAESALADSASSLAITQFDD